MVAVGVVLTVASCGGLEHGYTLQRYQGQLFSVPAGPGLERLSVERNYDSTIDTFVSQHGLPDALYVADRATVQLFYVQQDVVATFQRATLNPASKVTVTNGIPEALRNALRPPPPAQKAPPSADQPSPAVEVTTPRPTSPSITAAGTCFAVRPDGYLITSNHVIEGASYVVVYFPDHAPARAKIVTRDPSNDVALLKIAESTPTFLPLGQANAADLGDRLFTVGFPVPDLLGLEPKYSEGNLSAKSGIADVPTLMQVSLPVQPGNSGGPVLNERGEVIGIVAAQAAVEAFYGSAGTLPQNINWAVKAEYVSPLFKPAVHKVSPSNSKRDIIARAERAVCLVLAHE